MKKSFVVRLLALVAVAIQLFSIRNYWHEPQIAIPLAIVLLIIAIVLNTWANRLEDLELIDQCLDTYTKFVVSIKELVGDFEDWNAEAALVEKTELPHLGTVRDGVIRLYPISGLVCVKLNGDRLFLKKGEFGAIFYGSQTESKMVFVK